jgi:putative lipase involved disintegration of autophagic bodies
MNIIKKLSFICFLLISTYNGDNKDVSAQGASFEDVKWHPNGTSMYALANAADIIFQYTCTDPFNSSSCTYASKSLNGNSEDTNMNEFDFNDDGTKIFMLGNAADTVFQYTCTGAYDLSTCSYASISVSVTATASNPFGMTLNDDGSFLYVADRAGNDINQFKCTTPYTISSCSALGVTLSTLAETGAGLGFGIEWNGNGSSIFQVASGSDDLFQYDCTINYNLSSCSYSGRSFSFTTQETNPLG